MWGKRDKLSSTELPRLPQGNLRSAAARTDDGLTGCRIWRSAAVHCCQFNRLQDRGVVVLRFVYARRDRPHPHQFGRAWQARSLVRLSFGPRIGGERMVTGRGVSPDRLLGGDECWFGEPAGRGGSYTDMVNELLPSVSSRLWWYVRRTGNESSERTADELRTREARKRDDRRSLAIR